MKSETSRSAAAPAFPPAQPEAIRAWQALRFGMFIHWGPASLTGHEIGWSRGAHTAVEVYDNLYKQFNPTSFNADEWVSIAKAAGMKYIVLTAKHMDGFCLWDTKLTDYNIMNTPFGRDVVKELAAACKKQGIRFGAYYSVPDWYDKNWPTDGPWEPKKGWPIADPDRKVRRATYDLDIYAEYLRGQITELIKNYGPLLTIWNDRGHPNDGTAYGDQRGTATIRLVRALQPDILINNRTSAGTDYDDNRKCVGGDYGTPEQQIGEFDMDRPWESCMTVSGHDQWSWGGDEDGVKSTAACLEMLIRGAGGDGNVLLNVGPRPDGVIDPAQADLLKDIGAWLAKNGESIYGTRGGPWKPTNAVVSTRADDAVYLHVMNSKTGRVELPALPAEIKSAVLLNGAPVDFVQQDGKLSITIPPSALDQLDTIVKLELDRPAMEIPALTPASETATEAPAIAES
jgi:alpha-L-fucosidase